MCPSFYVENININMFTAQCKENSRDALFCAFYFLVLIKQRKIISYCGKYWLRGKEKTQCWVDVIQFALQVLA